MRASLSRSSPATLGPVTGSVNHAGIQGPRGRVADVTAREAMEVLSVNVAEGRP
jgi:NAD(P)-dependent dehydrogenase (short-subunit alcohol dehydrogenase family)